MPRHCWSISTEVMLRLRKGEPYRAHSQGDAFDRGEDGMHAVLFDFLEWLQQGAEERGFDIEITDDGGTNFAVDYEECDDY